MPLLNPRLHQKTTVRQSLPEPLDLGQEAAEDGKRKVYLVTFPRPKQERASTGEILVAPGSLLKKDVFEKCLDALRSPIYAQLWVAHGGVSVDRAMHVREHHEEDESGQKDVHDHTAVVAFHSFRYMPVKRALLQRHGLASHWSCSHTGYWSTVRYLGMPSPNKPRASLDACPLFWASDGAHPCLLDSCYAPITAPAITAKRQKLVQNATEKGEAEPKVNDLDVWALVVRAGLRNTPDNRKAHLQLASFAKQHCGEAMVHYLFRRRSQLPQMIDDIWQWENAEELAEESRLNRRQLLDAAESSACTCEGAWLKYVLVSFSANKINTAELCHDVLDALTRGRSETTPVIVLAGRQGGEGKSMFFKPLLNVYAGEGDVFAIAKESGNFPLLDLPKARVAFLDEYRFDPDVVSWATQCVWFDGSAVPVGRPQNQAGVTGNMMYKGTAPVFITTKLPDLEKLEYWATVNLATGNPWDADASMMWRRLKVYKFTTKIVKPSSNFSFCAHCFARMLKTQAPLWKP